jgi:CubicO group peptidase (beta-lactamase class C family)
MRTQTLALKAIHLTALCAFAASACLANPSADPPAKRPPLDADFADHIDKHLATLERLGLFEGSVLIAEGERVVLSRGYGYANAEHAVRNAPDTTFRIASITKQFTAVAILLLVDRGRLKLEDPISKHLSGLPPAWRDVSVRQLLDHTSGIPSYTDFLDLRSFSRTAQSPRSIMALAAEKPMNFKPGERFQYNNTSYIIAGALIEELSGKRYADFMQSELFEPNGLKQTGYAFNESVIPKLAQGYTQDAGVRYNAQFLDMSIPYAAGSLYSSTHDLLRWNRLLFGDVRTGQEQPGKILTSASLAEMLKGGKAGYGLGIGVAPSRRGTERGDKDSGAVYGHTGGMPGVNTVLEYAPATATTIAILANNDIAQSDAIANAIDLYARDRKTLLAHQYPKVAPSDASDTAGLIGRYAGQDGTGGEVQLVDGALHFMADGSRAQRLAPHARGKFYSPATLVTYTFVADDGGRIESLKTLLRGKPVTLSRMPAPNFAREVVYLRGSMNDWSTRLRLAAAPDQPHQLRARTKLAAGTHNLKFATEDWRTIDLGAFSQLRDEVLLNRPTPLISRGGNLRFAADIAGTYEFTLDMSRPEAPRVRVVRVGD